MAFSFTSTLTRSCFAVGLLSFAACAPSNATDNSAPVGTASTTSPAGLSVKPLKIMSGAAEHDFKVEVASSPAEQEKGLMFRTELGPKQGMIFPFPQDKVASFWMKNTVISLDLIFVRRDGTIESISANAVPYSLAPISSKEPVAAVLEIAASRAAELGLKAGDKVSW